MAQSQRTDKADSFIERFLAWEAAAGAILVIATVAAMLCSNSFLSPYYESFKSAPIFGMSLLFWINDLLMAVFFLLVGLELKREFLFGELSDPRQLTLPACAALFGMLCPAVVFLSITGTSTELTKGWATPAATDIAFALGTLALLGNRVSSSLKVFLTTVAVLDDLGAILIIALFYSAGLSFYGLLSAFLLIIGLQIARGRKARLRIFVVLGLGLWVAVLKSGIHPTLAGVILGLSIPAGTKNECLVEKLEERLHPWVSYLILPLFAFSNAGLQLFDLRASSLLAPLPIAIVLGLFLGKQFGVLGGVWLAVKAGWGSLPDGASWRSIHALSVICGIGFTMSLFISGLAFDSPDLVLQSRLGVVFGSLLCAVTGYLLMVRASKK